MRHIRIKLAAVILALVLIIGSACTTKGTPVTTTPVTPPTSPVSTSTPIPTTPIATSITTSPSPSMALTVTSTPSPSPSPIPSASPAATGTPTPVATSTPAPTPSLGPVIPPEVTQYAADWPLPQGNYESTRATFTSTINSSNVTTLGVAWTTPLKGATSTNPIIMGNNVFLQDNAYNIWSIDFATGKVNWSVTNNHEWIGPTGVCVGWGKVFGSSTSYDIAAWDMNTGKQVWDMVLSNANPDTHNDIQPIPYNNLVFTAVGPHVGGTKFGGISGWNFGVDQSTGLVKWAWAGTDSANIWGHPEFNDGSSSWFPPSIDTKTGIIYWGTKNPGGFGYGGPNASFPNGSNRPGPNLYSNCIVAQDSASGKMLWFNQTFPHDVYDHDFQNTPMLVTAPNVYNMLGQMDVAIGGGKAGVVYAFDRTTGSTLWSTPVGKHQNDTLGALPLTTALEVYPGVLGGIETHMAYADGVVFAPYNELWTSYNAFGLQKVQTITEGTGGIAALDVNTGKILWDTKLTTGCNFGAATVVNDLVFTSTYDGTIYALKRADGTQVWKFKAPAGMGINAWPSVAKDTIIFPFGVGAGPQLVAFKPGATGTIPTSNPVPLPTPSPSPTPVSSPTLTPAPTPTPKPTASP